MEQADHAGEAHRIPAASQGGHTSVEAEVGVLDTEPFHEPGADRASKVEDRLGSMPQWRDL